MHSSALNSAVAEIRHIKRRHWMMRCQGQDLKTADEGCTIMSYSKCDRCQLPVCSLHYQPHQHDCKAMSPWFVPPHVVGAHSPPPQQPSYTVKLRGGVFGAMDIINQTQNANQTKGIVTLVSLTRSTICILVKFVHHADEAAGVITAQRFAAKDPLVTKINDLVPHSLGRVNTTVNTTVVNVVGCFATDERISNLCGHTTDPWSGFTWAEYSCDMDHVLAKDLREFAQTPVVAESLVYQSMGMHLTLVGPATLDLLDTICRALSLIAEYAHDV